LFDWKTRKEVGIKHEPKPNLVIVPMSKKTQERMYDWKQYGLLELNDQTVMGDSDSKVRSVHYQLEGGTIKLSDTLTIETGEREKIDYVKHTYREGSYAIMAHFIGERALLRKHFPNVAIYSADGDAEGVDLSHVEKLLIYSMSFKTSKYTQRLARQANHDRAHPIVVDILVADKPGVGKAVYQSVAIKKENFVKNSYERAL